MHDLQRDNDTISDAHIYTLHTHIIYSYYRNMNHMELINIYKCIDKEAMHAGITNYPTTTKRLHAGE